MVCICLVFAAVSGGLLPDGGFERTVAGDRACCLGFHYVRILSGLVTWKVLHTAEAKAIRF